MNIEERADAPDRSGTVAVLVCGSREWEDREAVWGALDELTAGAAAVLIIEGGARGADLCAAAWAEARGAWHEQYRAEWDQHGRRAGPLRNQAMLARLEELSGRGHPCTVVAFKHGLDVAGGRGGTEHMVSIARRAGFTVVHRGSVAGNDTSVDPSGIS